MFGKFSPAFIKFRTALIVGRGIAPAAIKDFCRIIPLCVILSDGSLRPSRSFRNEACRMEKTKEQTCLRRRDLLTNFVVLPRESYFFPWQPIGHRFEIPLGSSPSWFWVGSGLPPQNFDALRLLRMTHRDIIWQKTFIAEKCPRYFKKEQI